MIIETKRTLIYLQQLSKDIMHDLDGFGRSMTIPQYNLLMEELRFLNEDIQMMKAKEDSEC